MSADYTTPLIGVLALQGAFEEHQKCLEQAGARTTQVRTPKELENLDGLVLPGGESTAMGLIGTASTGKNEKSMWECLKEFTTKKPTWGTCAGMILLAEQCVGASAVIEDGQALVGGMDMLVCRNYFGSQVSSFEMATPPPPNVPTTEDSFPGVFIRAPAILSAGENIEVLGRVLATPCKQAAVVLDELEQKLAKGENVVVMGVVDALERKSPLDITYKEVVKSPVTDNEQKKTEGSPIELPGAANGTNARNVICAVKKGNILCTAFHPELTDDYRWHEYFVQVVRDSK